MCVGFSVPASVGLTPSWSFLLTSKTENFFSFPVHPFIGANAPYFWTREGALKSIFITSGGICDLSCTVSIGVLSLLLHRSFKLL